MKRTKGVTSEKEKEKQAKKPDALRDKSVRQKNYY